MKDPEFIELLNLYLDHEISPGDAARLEAEVQGNAERRRIYREYCRMQKACRVLAGEFEEAAEHAPESFDPIAVPAKSWRRTGSYYAAGALLAAACVALVFVADGGRQPPGGRLSPVESSRGDAGNMTHTGLSMTQARSLARTVSMPAPVLRASETSLWVDPFSLTRNARSDALLRAAAEEAAAQFAWMENIQLAPLEPPLRAETLHFEEHPARLRSESRSYGSRLLPEDPKAEMSAFQFQK